MRWVSLIVFAALVPRATYSQGTQFHWDARAKYDFDIPDLDIADKILSERGRISGVLENTEAMVVGRWDVEATAALKGDGYKLRADAFVKAEHWVSGKGLSTSSINGGMSWNDRFRIVGEGQLPFDSTVAKWKFHADFEHGDESDWFYYWDVYGKVTLSDPAATNSFNATVEYFRTNREEVPGIGPNSWSGVAIFTYDLDSNRSSPYNLELAIDGRTTGSWLRFRGGKTFELLSIEFPDGSTPEEHGFEIVFDSGLISPNLLHEEPAGDFNDNGVVDAGDYTVWRDSLMGSFTQPHYDLWQQNFGTVAPGTGADGHTSDAVPESAAVSLAAIAACSAALFRWRRPDARRI